MSEHGTGTTLERRAGEPRPPTLLDALLPVCVLIGLIALTISLFGVSATDGPLQVALLLSAAFASLIAFKNGYSPILDVLYGFLGFKVASRTPTSNGSVETSSAEGPGTSLVRQPAAESSPRRIFGATAHRRRAPAGSTA